VTVGDGGTELDGCESEGEYVAEVGVGDRFDRCARVMERPSELKKDIVGTETNQSDIKPQE